jgi:hypothetical protein
MAATWVLEAHALIACQFESDQPHQKSEEVIGLERCFKAHYEGHY